MKVMIDRFEGNFAIVELADKNTVDMPLGLVPQGAKEGDVLNISLDREETRRRKKRLEKLMEDLFDHE